MTVTLPPLSDPGANYVMWTRSGNILYVTGQLPKWDNERRFIGRVGAELDISQGQQAARLCALNVVTVVQAALDGKLDRVVRCLRVRVFVNGGARLQSVLPRRERRVRRADRGLRRGGPAHPHVHRRQPAVRLCR